MARRRCNVSRPSLANTRSGFWPQQGARYLSRNYGENSDLTSNIRSSTVTETSRLVCGDDLSLDTSSCFSVLSLAPFRFRAARHRTIRARSRRRASRVACRRFRSLISVLTAPPPRCRGPCHGPLTPRSGVLYAARVFSSHRQVCHTPSHAHYCFTHRQTRTRTHIATRTGRRHPCPAHEVRDRTAPLPPHRPLALVCAQTPKPGGLMSARAPPRPSSARGREKPVPGTQG